MYLNFEAKCEYYYQELIKRVGEEEYRKENFKQETLLAYFKQINGEKLVTLNGNLIITEELAATELRSALASGGVRLKWIEEDRDGEKQEPYIHITDDESGKFVEVVLTQKLFDLMAKDSNFYYEETRGMIGKGLDRLGHMVGGLIGYEASGRVRMVSPKEAALLGTVRGLVKVALEKYLEVLKEK